MKKLLITQLTLLLLFTSMVFGNTYGVELIQGAGNDLGAISQSKWQALGRTFGVKDRTYQGEKFLYPNNRKNKGGAYQSFTTEIGKTYQVNTILLGTDANKKRYTSHQ